MVRQVPEWAPKRRSFGFHGNLVCALQVFASPTEDAVLAAIRAVTGPAGCLLCFM